MLHQKAIGQRNPTGTAELVICDKKMAEVTFQDFNFIQGARLQTERFRGSFSGALRPAVSEAVQAISTAATPRRFGRHFHTAGA